ncbi:hypothetical protein LguiB_020858 [Lonicera macranthoides]
MSVINMSIHFSSCAETYPSSFSFNSSAEIDTVASHTLFVSVSISSSFLPSFLKSSGLFSTFLCKFLRFCCVFSSPLIRIIHRLHSHLFLHPLNFCFSIECHSKSIRPPFILSSG